jgi:hypothetical protein
MQNKTIEEYTKILEGSVQRQLKKCGKPNCRCARGDLHGPYYYHFVRIEGKLVRRYLKPGKSSKPSKPVYYGGLSRKSSRYIRTMPGSCCGKYGRICDLLKIITTGEE